MTTSTTKTAAAGDRRVKPLMNAFETDPLSNPDYTFDEKGEVVRKPPPAHDAGLREGVSPLPWAVGRNDRVEAANGRVVADMTFSSHGEQRAPANAAFIVQAINTHAALITTLETARRLLATSDLYSGYCAQIDEVLGRARGESGDSGR